MKLLFILNEGDAGKVVSALKIAKVNIMTVMLYNALHTEKLENFLRENRPRLVFIDGTLEDNPKHFSALYACVINTINRNDMHCGVYTYNKDPEIKLIGRTSHIDNFQEITALQKNLK